MARSRKAKQWTGILAEPIKTLMPEPYETPEEWIDRQTRHVKQQQIAKLPELGRQLGMQVDKYDLTTTDGLVVFYQHLALRLALMSALAASDKT